jgi:hypothetical protein
VHRGSAVWSKALWYGREGSENVDKPGKGLQRSWLCASGADLSTALDEEAPSDQESQDAPSDQEPKEVADPRRKPVWYRGDFTDWAKEVLMAPVLPNIDKHNSATRINWCGVPSYPYPNMVVDPKVVRSVVKTRIVNGRPKRMWGQWNPAPMTINTPLRYRKVIKRKGGSKSKVKKSKKKEVFE